MPKSKSKSKSKSAAFRTILRVANAMTRLLPDSDGTLDATIVAKAARVNAKIVRRIGRDNLHHLAEALGVDFARVGYNEGAFAVSK